MFNQFKNKFLIVFLIFVMAFGFPAEIFAAVPTIATDAATLVADTTATLNGTISSDGGSSLSARGFQYGLDTNYGSTVLDTSTGSFVYDSQFGSSGSGNGQFDGPYGIAIDATGNIYVVDGNNNRVQKFNSSGVYQSQFGSNGSGDGQFNTPRGIDFDSSGNIYVVDTFNSRVQKFNSSGVYQTHYTNFNYPVGIAIDPQDNMYIGDQGNSRIVKLIYGTNIRANIASNGSGNGQVYSAYNVTFDANANDKTMYIVDTYNHRIQKFVSDGYQSQFGSNGSGDGQFGDYNFGIAIDSNGNIYTADNNSSNRIQKFDSSGVYQSQFGASGNGNGEFGSMAGIAIDATGNIYAVDPANDRVQKFRRDNLPTGSFSLDVTGLACSTTYHYRTYSTNVDGTGYGSDQTFTTDACAPTVEASSVTSITPTSATISGDITATGGASVTVRGFEYGLDTNYGTTTTENGSFSTGTYTANISGLTCNTNYHFRAYATNSIDTTYSSDNTFNSGPCAPTVTTNTAVYVSATSQSLKGEIVSTGGEDSTVRGFQWGLDTNYGNDVPESGTFSDGVFSATITGLTEDVTYHYRAYATNTTGTTYGNDATFVAGELISISSCTAFEDINQDTDSLDGAYILTRDLDCRSDGNDVMVATSDPFTGFFEGNGHTITVNIHSSGTDNIGLFNYVSEATISNLNIAGSILGQNNVGALVGNLENDSNSDHPVTTISNVHSTANVYGAVSVGGLIGALVNSGFGEDGDTTAVNITSSSSSGSVTSSGENTGGLIGRIDLSETANVNITNSYATGNVKGSYQVGGIVGYFEQYGGEITFTGNHYSGNVVGDSGSGVGGLIGYLYSELNEGYANSAITISNNFTSGSVSETGGALSLGGLIGLIEITNYDLYSLTVSIVGNYSTSSITATAEPSAGLIGQLYLYNDDAQYDLNFNLEQNYYEGTITASNGAGETAGLIGRMEIDSNSIVANLSKNYFSGTITAEGPNVGGLIGELIDSGDTDITISDSYVSATITTSDTFGGLIGYAVSNNSSELNINRSYAKGILTGTDYGGGFIGYLENPVNISDSFASVDVSSLSAQYGALVGYTTVLVATTNVFFDQTISGGFECVDNLANMGCTPVNTTGSPDDTYFESNHTNAPLDQWNFSTVWVNKAGINDNYPVFPNTTAGLSILPATSITSTTATLNANLVATGGENITTRGFNYGLTTSYGSTTTEVGSFSAGSFSTNISSLTSCTTYHYRAYTKNVNDVYSYSSDTTLNTCGASVITLDTNSLGSTSVKLNGNINNLNGSNATVRGFQYGLNTNYGTTISEAGNFSTGLYFLTASSLTPGTTYHYRAYATNNAGTTYGDDATFSISATSNISSCADFEAIGTNTTTLDGEYLLTTDLDCSYRHENVMIAESDPFTGIFDGGGHTITVNIHNSGVSNIGLFSTTSGATISNLNIAGSVIGRNYVGSLIANLSNPSLELTTISNVHSTATVIGTQGYVGGLIGLIDNQGNSQFFDTTAVNIVNSSHTGIVSGTAAVGGLIGYIYQEDTANINIINSYATGTVSGDQGYVGGLIGQFEQYDGNARISGNYFSGSVDGDDVSVGGLIGYTYVYPSGNYADSKIDILNNHSVGTVTGDGEAGGLIGTLYIENNQEYPLIATIQDNYSTSNVTSSSSYIGGLVGYVYTVNNYTNYSATISFTQNYAENTVTATDNQGYVGGLIGATQSGSDNIHSTLSKNYFSGAIMTADGHDVGGLIGNHQDSGDIMWTISDSYAVADITADYNIGGILGQGDMDNGLNIERVYSTGIITGSNPSSSSVAGGLVGVAASNVTVSNSFSGVTITDFDADFGALIGVQNDTTFTNNFFDQNLNVGLDCTGSGTASSCTPVDTVAGVYFKSNHTNAPLSNWNFNTIWRNQTNVNNNYPILQQFNPISIPTVVTSNAQLLRGTTATLYGNVTSTGTENNSLQGFNYGLNTSYGSTASVSGSFTDGIYSIVVSNLQCGTEYHYQAFSANSAGTGYGSDMTFNTTGCSVGGSGPGSRSSSPSSSSSVPSLSSNIKPIVNNNNSYVQINKFTKKLKYKDNNLDVKNLQKFLNTIGFTVSQKGAGSKGFETNYFGVATKKSVIAFQKAYKLQPDGVVGPNTLKVINSLAK